MSALNHREEPCVCIRPTAVLVAGLVLLSFSAGLTTAQIIPFVTDPINAANETPCPQTFPGSGVGVFNLDLATNRVVGKVVYSGLQSPETACHIHREAVCVAGGVIFPLPLGSPKNISYGPLTAAQVTDMNNHLHYINIHTSLAPGGQIRGQLVRLSGPSGGCCLKGGTECLITDATRCNAIGGIYQGDGTACGGIQACCTPNGCVMVDALCCDDLGGVPQGPGTNCTDPNICACQPSPTQPDRCKNVACPTIGDHCQPKCVNYNPFSGQTAVLDCECGNLENCHVQVPGVAGPGGAGVRGGGNPCIVPDNGGGTVTLPPAGCEYLSPDDVHRIIDGLPAGTTIELAPIHKDFICHKQGVPIVCSFQTLVDCDEPGGSLGGEKECNSSNVQFQLMGTGTLAGYNRMLQIPLSFETHTAPRTPGQPVQSFDTDMFRMFGQLPPGDPDFDLLRVVGGTDFGLPSPGHTTLTQLPLGNWAVDSFFDITYRIDFVGAPGGPLAGRSGSTTATIRMATGNGPSCVGVCPPGTVCEETRTVQANGTIDICCNCVPAVCGPDPVQADRCRQVTCPIAGENCQPKCVDFDPALGQTFVVDCECGSPNDCHVQVPGVNPTPQATRGGGNPCVVPDNGGGTVTLPPAGCEYLSPDDVHRIIDGLPPNTTIELAPIHKDFICNKQGVQSVCSFQTLVDCDEPGGSLGGEKECNSSNIQFQLTGTGALAGYNRMLQIPLSFETHTAPRTPGQPVQSFDTDMFRMFGQIMGDPDFDLLRITAGTDFGLPSPGHTTLTQLPGGNWAVDSFFDIEYRIDFVGAPGGPLSGMSGSTTATIRMATGNGPSCTGVCPPGTVCEESRIVLPDGKVRICCNCVPVTCGPDPVNPTLCQPVQCPVPGDACLPRCARYNPATGQSVVTDCECRPDTDCHVVIPGPPMLLDGQQPDARGSGNPCIVTGVGGTVVLPPAGCAYLSPDDVHQIIDGLPAGTTIELAPIHQNFICNRQPGGGGVCSFSTLVDCDQVGGSLGGEQECAESQIQFQAQGTGTLNTYNRTLNIPLSFETHTAPRTPGNPVQSFDTDMFRMFGQLPPGDPDFDLLRVTGGTDFGMPSPGHTTLTQLPGGNWAVDSFFDITYRIDFVGKPGGPLGGMSGSTTGTIRMATGMGPQCQGNCPPGTTCRETRTVNPDGTIDVCCDCVAACQCLGDLNLDCLLNGKDIKKFIECLLMNPQPMPLIHPCDCADMDNNGAVTMADLPLFVQQLLAVPKVSCPPDCVPGV